MALEVGGRKIGPRSLNEHFKMGGLVLGYAKSIVQPSEDS